MSMAVYGNVTILIITSTNGTATQSLWRISNIPKQILFEQQFQQLQAFDMQLDAKESNLVQGSKLMSRILIVCITLHKYPTCLQLY